MPIPKSLTLATALVLELATLAGPASRAHHRSRPVHRTRAFPLMTPKRTSGATTKRSAVRTVRVITADVRRSGVTFSNVETGWWRAK
jgi:hypothetical protein